MSDQPAHKPTATPEPDGDAASPTVPAIGDLVISSYDDQPVVYGGPGDGPWTTLTFQLGAGQTPTRRCDPQDVAPADTPIAANDARVAIEKRPRTEMPYGEAGPWRLSLPDQRPSWHRTKRDATATGLRRLAIADWHAAAVTA